MDSVDKINISLNSQCVNEMMYKNNDDMWKMYQNNI